MRRWACLLALGLVMGGGVGGLASTAEARPPAWKLLINDAFRGPLDHRYGCATAKEALKHVPGAVPRLNWIEETLLVYKRTVC